MKIPAINFLGILIMAGLLGHGQPALAEEAPRKEQIALPEEYVAFVTAKEKQAGDIARKHDLELSADERNFFAAAKLGRAKEAMVLLRKLREDTSSPASKTPLTEVRREMALAIIALQEGYPDLVLGLGREIMKSLPPGSIYFGGTDPGRGLPTMLCKSPGDPVYVITQNELVDQRYLDLLKGEFGAQLRLPTSEDVKRIEDDYITDAMRRQKSNQLKPGETIETVDGKPTPQGAVAVMEINGQIVKYIIDGNPKPELYYEESYPLDWLNPFLSPHGLIMKINREPLESLAADDVKADADFWAAKLKSLADNPKFADDTYTRKSYAHMRSCQARLFAWWARYSADTGEKQRMYAAAKAAYDEALSLAPTMPETVWGLATLAAGSGKVDDAIATLKNAVKADPANEQFKSYLKQLERYKAQSNR
jgi:tetratricopeptide (TPR) repeat protein